MPSKAASGRYLAVAGIIVLVLAAWGIYARLAARSALATEAANDSIPVVSTIAPSFASAGDSVSFPADVQPMVDAPIYARANGYLARRLVDIGSRVKKGELLAEIDAPELRQQILQAQADLANTQASEALARTTVERWQQMIASDSVAKQEVDEKVADAKAKRAALAAARANVARLQELGGFQRIVAPFDGVITARNTDIGALVNAGSSPSAGQELFHIASIDRLRAYVNVPQPFASIVRPGAVAKLKVSELPGVLFDATIESTSESLDPTSRTLRVRLAVDNHDSKIRPGSYAEALFASASDAKTLRVPSNCLLFGGNGLSVVRITAANTMAIVPIIIGRDFGKEVEVLSGMKASDRIVLNPPDSALDGTRVRVRTAGGAS